METEQKPKLNRDFYVDAYFETLRYIDSLKNIKERTTQDLMILLKNYSEEKDYMTVQENIYTGNVADFEIARSEQDLAKFFSRLPANYDPKFVSDSQLLYVVSKYSNSDHNVRFTNNK